MYIVFAVFNPAIIPCVWISVPETSKRFREEIELYFAKAHSEGASPVNMAREMPRYHAAELDGELMRYWGR